jgi:hypothetical protein
MAKNIEPTAIEPTVIDEIRPKFLVLALFGILGAFTACLIDNLQNDTAAVTLKINYALSRMLELDIPGSVNILIISILGAVACKIQETKSFSQAFTHGLMVFTIFNLVVPNNRVTIENKNGEDKQKVVSTMSSHSYNDDYIIQSVSFQEFKPNARVVKNEWISKDKPEYSGPFGLGSLLSNSIKINSANETLASGHAIEVLCYWDTNLRGYRYAKIRYEKDGIVKCGWIWTGKNPTEWSQINVIDKNNFTVTVCTDNKCS